MIGAWLLVFAGTALAGAQAGLWQAAAVWAVSAHIADSAIAVTVSDTGPGIAPEDLSRIFDRFYRVDPSRARSAGLGLTIARQLTEAHVGSIQAQSAPGQGSHFSIHILTT